MPWKGKMDLNKNLDKIHCGACQGWGHYANERANFIRKVKGSAYWVDLDEDVDSNEDSDYIVAFTVFTGGVMGQVTITSSTTSEQDDITFVSNPSCMSSSFSICADFEVDDLPDIEAISKLQSMFEQLLKETVKQQNMIFSLSAKNSHKKI